jgi:LPXTG-motif cell wall-anchored protein
VLGTEVLPFTGVESEWTFWLATILALTGGLLVFGAKRAED